MLLLYYLVIKWRYTLDWTLLCYELILNKQKKNSLFKCSEKRLWKQNPRSQHLLFFRGSDAVQEKNSERLSPFANLTTFCLLSHQQQQYIFQKSICVHSQVCPSQFSSIYNLSCTHVTLLRANGVAQVYPRQKYLYYWWWCLNREKSSLMSSWVCKTVRWKK